MDIRDELQAMRVRLDCHETMAIPGLLRRIARSTGKLADAEPLRRARKGRMKRRVK